MKEISKDALDFMMNHPHLLGADFLQSHNNQRTSNAVEGFMALMKRVKSSEFHIRNMELFNAVKYLLQLMLRMNTNRLEDLDFDEEGDDVGCPYVKKAMKAVADEVHDYLIFRQKYEVDIAEYIVTEGKKEYNVNRYDMSCSCKYMKQTGFPCIHAVALLVEQGKISSILGYVNHYYLKKNVYDSIVPFKDYSNLMEELSKTNPVKLDILEDFCLGYENVDPFFTGHLLSIGENRLRNNSSAAKRAKEYEKRS